MGLVSEDPFALSGGLATTNAKLSQLLPECHQSDLVKIDFAL